MALSKQTYTGDGVAQEFTFSIPRIKDADLKAFVDDVEVSIEDITGNTVRLDNVPANGSEVVIQRRTNIDSLEVEFPNRGYIGQTDLETDYLQELYLHQEASDDRDDLQEAIDNGEGGGGDADGNGIYSGDGSIDGFRFITMDYDAGVTLYNWQQGLPPGNGASLYTSSTEHLYQSTEWLDGDTEEWHWISASQDIAVSTSVSGDWDNHTELTDVDYGETFYSVGAGIDQYGDGETSYTARFGAFTVKYINQSAQLVVDHHIYTGESNGTVGKAYYNGTEIATVDDIGLRNGFIDYNDTSTSSSALVVSADTWTTIPNDGAGAFSNDTYKPNGNVTELMDTSTGAIDPTGLELGDTILIRNDFSVTPSTNNASLEFRYSLGDTGAGTNYVLEKRLGRLDEGSGIPYRFSLSPDLIYMGDTNTRNNPIQLQVKCTSNATLVNAGSVIQVIRR